MYRRLVMTLVAGFAALAFLSAAPALAQTPVRKVPSGPFVLPGPTNSSIVAGEQIVWTITITNASPFQDAQLSFVDEPQDLECETGGGGNANESELQNLQYFEDPAGDSTCGAAVTGSLTPVTIDCDLGTQRLAIDNITVLRNGGTATITFSTRVDAAASPGFLTCNWGHFFSPLGAPLGDTYPPNGGVAGCTCLLISPPTAFDFEATKSVVIDPASGVLVPDDPTSTVTYTITARNTGGEDITDGSLEDVLPASGEWVSIVSCPAPLTCEIDPTDAHRLTAVGYALPAADPDPEQTIVARARVACGAATDDDTGRLCNQGRFILQGGRYAILTDDPSLAGPDDPTCVPVVWSNLTQSEKFMSGFEDTNPANGLIDRGEYVTFTIRARNEGRHEASSVEIRDPVGLLDDCFNIGSVRNISAGGTVDITDIVWNVGTLPPLVGQVDVSYEIQLVGTATTCCNQAFLNSQERRDCAQAAIPSDDASTTAAGDPTCVTPGPAAILEVTKTYAIATDTDPIGTINPGDDLAWTVTVTNTGAGTATNATFIDVLQACQGGFTAPDTITTTDADGNAGNDASRTSGGTDPGEVRVNGFGGPNGIVPGETVTVSWVTRLRPGTTCCNQATVSYLERAEPERSNDPATIGVPRDPTCVVAPPALQASLSKSARLIDASGDGTFDVGELVEYTLVFTNTGNTDLTGISISDPSSACIEFQASPASVDPPGSGTIAFTGNDWTVDVPGPLAPGAEVTIRVRAQAIAGGTCCNTARWATAELPGGGLSDVNTGNAFPEEPTCHAAVEAPTEIRNATVTKVAYRGDCTTPIFPGDCLDPGGAVCFIVDVENTGNVDLSYDLEDVLPAGFGGSVSVNPPLTYTRATNTVSARGGPLARGAVDRYQYSVRVPCDVGGTLTNTARVTFALAGGGTEERTDSATVTWGLPDIRVSTKVWAEADPAADADTFITDADEKVHFTIDVCNDAAATCTARSVVVMDDLADEFDGATIDASSEGGVVDAVNATIRWDTLSNVALESIDPGECVTLTFLVEVDAAVPTSMPRLIPNVAIVEARGNSLAGCLAPPSELRERLFDTVWLEGPGGNGRVPYAGILDNRQHVLINNDAPSLGGAIPIYRTSVFDAPTPNTTTCGTNGLDVATDVSAYTDVEAALEGAGLFVPRTDTDVQGPLVFFQVTERCEPAVGGSDNPICVTKTATDYVIRASATGSCP